MTTKDHLKAMHTQTAEFHTAAAKHHKQLAKCFGNMSKAAEGIESAADIESAHLGLMEQHLSQAEFHVQCATDLATSNKAAGMSDYQLEPIGGISSVFLTEPSTTIRPVARHGQPTDFGKASTGIDSGLAKIVGLED